MKHRQWTKDGFLLRPALREDAPEYYEHNFAPLDPEVARLTGSRRDFTREEVVSAFLRWVDADDRYTLLLISPEGHIIGESVLNELDPELRSANFRICLFHPEHFGKSLGSWMTEKTLELAFEEAKLHRVSLSVFSFNPRAIRTYEKAGFRKEGILPPDDTSPAEEILMSIGEADWKYKIG